MRRRRLPLAVFLPFLRWVSTTALIVSLIIGGYRFITSPFTAGALEFTPHHINHTTDATGVLGVGLNDMDNDGDMDIVTSGRDGVKVYSRNSSGTFDLTVVEKIDAVRLQLFDLDNDGDTDILVTLATNPSVKWYRNDGNLNFDGSFIGTGSEGKAFAGDLDGDKVADIVTATKESEVFVLRRWMNNGLGTFTSTVLSSDSGVKALAIADVNGNGFQDIVTGGSKGLQNWDTTDGLTWSRNDIDDVNKDFTYLTIADVNGNDRNDIVAADQVGNKVIYYRHLEHSRFERIMVSSDTDATTVKVIDLDEDGDEDIIAAAQDDNGVFWFDNDGSESFTKRTLASGLQSPLAVDAADIDDDNDFDFAVGDHFRGKVYWYERVRAKPAATAPDDIQQAATGSGYISFDTTISDDDFDPTRIRVQYSVDGEHWYKPYLVQVKPAVGSVDLRNANGYQVGTSNAIDTNTNDSVKLTLWWNTKTVENTGGPIVGDTDTVQLRVIPRDDLSVGAAAVSDTFRVDNAAPTGLSNVQITDINETEATLTWNAAQDSGSFTYKIYYGTSHTDVLDQNSDVWDGDDDETMNDVENTSATITDLTPNKTYTFKIFAVDAFGNQVGAPSVKGVTVSASAASSPLPSGVPVSSPSSTASPAATPTATASPAFSPTITLTPTVSPSPLVSPSPSAITTTTDNTAPVADAGFNQVVNPSALVILDGTASFDPDDDPLNFTWRQLSGPVVDLVSARTSTPSFAAGGENETYIFSLTIQDQSGASATDTMIVATKTLPKGEAVTVETTKEEPPTQQPAEEPQLVRQVLRPLNWFLLALALFSTGLSVTERTLRALRDRRSVGATLAAGGGIAAPKGTIVHYRTGEPIAGAMVMIYGADGKLRARERTGAKGEFATLFPPGQYTLGVQAPGFIFAPATSRVIKPEAGILYSGGKITVQDGNKPLEIVVPMKPTGQEISSLRTRFLHMWQAIQRIGRVLSWPIFVMGALINTVLVFWVPSPMYLIIEVLYVLLVIVKVAMEVRVRPAYGLVRDAITHVPLDLAVVRLFEQGTNRLIMTRVTNAQGKFFALPPSGKYTITATKPGYAVFTKENVNITSEQDSVLQITTDLMPVAPTGGLTQARAAIL